MKEKELTVERSIADFKTAYSAKRDLLEKEKDDFLFALGKQWDEETEKNYKDRKIKPVTDNRIQPNIFLLTGLERQNRSEFKAFPEGEEDSLRAEIASSLFKNSIKVSDYLYKSSEQFKDGVTCGESHLELYIDNTWNIINGKPCWKKVDGDCLFPEPGYREYDFSDARYVYKLTKGISKDDLISLYPDMSKKIEEAEEGILNFDGMSGSSVHVQKRDYGTKSNDSEFEKEKGFDLVERYYKKWVEVHFVGDKKTGQVKETEDEEKADEFINTVNANAPENVGRFIHITRKMPEIWIYACVPGISEPLADERAWFYPKWKTYPFIPYFARFSTAPIDKQDGHLLIQGVVRGVKNVQEKHNKAESLKLLHLNSAANSGWEVEEDQLVDPKALANFGATPGIVIERKKGTPPLTRLFPMQLSQGHTQIAAEAAEAIKAQLGINADLLAVQDGSSQSGRAIALRQRQGLLMVQELFDNLSRTRQIAGKFLLSQLGEMYDTDTAKKILGEVWLQKNFSTPTVPEKDPVTGAVNQMPMTDPMGQPLPYDIELAEAAIADVLSGELWNYDVAVGESVSSETMKMANSMEIKDFAATYPGLLPPDIIIEESQLPQGTKNKILGAIRNAQQQQQQQQMAQMTAAAQPPMPINNNGGL